MRLLPFVALACLLVCGGLRPAIAQAQQQGVQRCTTMSGDTVYTDKRCEDVGAMDRLPPASTAMAATGALYRGGCSRTLSDLVMQVSSAIQAQDVNRLAGVYHWAGTSELVRQTVARLRVIFYSSHAVRILADHDPDHRHPRLRPDRPAIAQRGCRDERAM